jgi:hypothetical protein
VPTGYLVLGSGSFTPPCQLATVDLSTGVVTDLPAPPAGDGCGPIAVAPDGAVWQAQITSTTVTDDNGGPVFWEAVTLVRYAADGRPAASFPIGSPVGDYTGGPRPPAIPSFRGLTIRPDGSFLVEEVLVAPPPTATCTVGVPDCWSLYRVDPAGGTWTQVGPTGAALGPAVGLNMASCRDGLFLDDRAGSWASQDPGTGAITPIAPAPANVGLGCPIDGTVVYALQNLQSNLNDPLPEHEIGTVDRATGVFAGSGTLLAYGDQDARIMDFTVGPFSSATPVAPSSAAAAVAAAPGFTG